MMVRQEMVEAAARADASYAGRTFDALASSNKVRFTERAKLMLEAALAASSEIDRLKRENARLKALLEAALSTEAEPVKLSDDERRIGVIRSSVETGNDGKPDSRVSVKQYQDNDSLITISMFMGNHQWIEGSFTAEDAAKIASVIIAKPAVAAIYAEPVRTAPAVAVKAIEAVWIKHDGKSMPVNAETVVEVRMAGGFEHEEDLAGNWLEREGSKSNWRHDLGCPHPCDIVAYRIVKGSPALSAKVQDVAGWQPIETAPKDGTVILGGHEAAVITVWWEADGSQNNTGEPGWIDGAFNSVEENYTYPVTHWMPLPVFPASPASKHGGP